MMQARDELGAFLRDGLAAGHAPEALAAALRAAGWPEARIAAGLALWQQAAGLPPVPVPRAGLSPRDALVHGLGFAALAMLSWHVVQLGFLLAEHVTEGVGQLWAGAARWPVAMLVVVLPVFALLHLRAGAPSQVRRWLAALSGFLAGLALLGSLAATIHALLSGDLTLRFALKAGVVGVTAALVFATYRAELSAASAAARLGRAGAGALAGLAVLAIAGGLWLTGGPGQGRAEQRDAARMADLEALAGQARCLALEGRKVPPIGVSDRCPDDLRAADPWTGADYAVEAIGADRLRLCAVVETRPVWRDEVAGPGCVLVDLSELRAAPGGAETDGLESGGQKAGGAGSGGTDDGERDVQGAESGSRDSGGTGTEAAEAEDPESGSSDSDGPEAAGSAPDALGAGGAEAGPGLVPSDGGILAD